MEKAAVLKLEELTSLKFVTQTWDCFLDRWPMSSSSKWWDGSREMAISEIVSYARNIVFPFGIAQALTEFSTYSDDAEFAQSVSEYVTDTVGNRARVGLKLGGVWPTTILRPNNGIRFRFTLGFGAASAVPSDIKQAVMEFVSHMYENRGDNEKMIAIPSHVLTLVARHRREKLGC